ncbi:Fic family protein [Idiomarina sp. HP20-50]|uniref:Fic family protein n=1 Tax=Idiomarina sp. HP20-50 TaxID=3070813 RepID=UPI00294B94BB|nr:Fic family protein [Idiomarina sp. HP20-50]
MTKESTSIGSSRSATGLPAHFSRKHNGIEPVYIHPYFDGNGRIGRFIMNLMLASGGYPWTVVPVERRI